MEKQEYLFIPDEVDREFAEIDDAVCSSHPDYAAVTEEKRRVAYFLISCTRTEKMPQIAAKAKVSLGKCYELIKDPDCRTAQNIIGRILRDRDQANLQSETNATAQRIGKLIQAGKLKQLSKEMIHVCHSAELHCQLTPRDLVLMNLSMQDYLLAKQYMPADIDCVQRVKTALEAI